MRSWTRTGAGPCSSRSIARTCSSSRWTTAAAGIAITISSGTCCERTSLDEQPDVVPLLQHRASLWFEQKGDAPEAIRHALAAADYPRAADLIERAGPSLRSTRREALLLAWLKAIPDDVLAVRPVLSVNYAGALLSLGQLAGAEERLQAAERWLDTDAGGSPRPRAELVGRWWS